MTVTELREALQKLEAEGKGGLQVVHTGNHYRLDSPEFQSIDSVTLEEATELSAERGLAGPVVHLGY
jgi:hypothetical protein